MKKIGISAILLILFILTAASKAFAYYNLATRQDEFILISDSHEVSMGKSVAKNVEREFKPINDILVQKRVEAIGQRIAKHCDRKTIRYHFKALEKNEINAFALPGGYVFIFKGLLDKIKSDDQLAAVLAHEIAHVTARHGVKKMQSAFGYNALILLAMGTKATSQNTAMTNEALIQLMMSYNREDEMQADKLAVKYMRNAGFNPQGMVDFLYILRDIQRNEPIRPMFGYRTHPYIPERIAVVKEEVGTRNFADYLNKPDPEPR